MDTCRSISHYFTWPYSPLRRSGCCHFVAKALAPRKAMHSQRRERQKNLGQKRWLFASPLPFLAPNFFALPITATNNEVECDGRREIRSSYLVIVIRRRNSSSSFVFHLRRLEDEHEYEDRSAEYEVRATKRMRTSSDQSNSRHQFNHSQTTKRSTPLEHPTDEPNS
jgi:hypothetical protein